MKQIDIKTKVQILKILKNKYGITDEQIMPDIVEEKIAIILEKMYINHSYEAFKEFQDLIDFNYVNINSYILIIKDTKIEFTTLGHIILIDMQDMETFKYLLKQGYDYNLKDSNGISTKSAIEDLKENLKILDDIYQETNIS